MPPLRSAQDSGIHAPAPDRNAALDHRPPDHPARHLRGHVGLVMRKALQLDRNACQRLPTHANACPWHVQVT